MKQVKSLILMLLIPLAMFLGSCSNELEEELMVEVEYYSDNPTHTIDDIDYFIIKLKKYDDTIPFDPTSFSGPYRELKTQRLEKGEILRLENSLEPGLYLLEGYAYDHDNYIICNIYGKSSNMTTLMVNEGNTVPKDFIVVEPGVPAIIKLVISLH